jgi:pimeloyl-ACP methyl ester carboxylesterase
MTYLPVFKSGEAREKVLAAYEAALARWPAAALGGRPLERLRVATEAGETAVLAFGAPAGEGAAAAPLILVHGTGTNSSMWLGDAAALAQGRRVYAVDIPGEPGMSEDRKLEWRPGESGRWLAEVAGALGLGDHALLGLSIGGWIALDYARSRPTGLRALALLCPSGIGRTRPSFTLKAILQMARGRRGFEVISRYLYGDLPPPEEAIRVGTLIAESTNPRMEKPGIFPDGELARIAAPIFLAVGAKDALLRSRESAARLGRIKPEAEILMLPGAGHALIGLGERVAAFLAAQ